MSPGLPRTARFGTATREISTAPTAVALCVRAGRKGTTTADLHDSGSASPPRRRSSRGRHRGLPPARRAGLPLGVTWHACACSGSSPASASTTVGGAERLVRELATRAHARRLDAPRSRRRAPSTTTPGRTSCRRAAGSRTASSCAASRSARATAALRGAAPGDPLGGGRLRRRARVAREQRLVARPPATSSTTAPTSTTSRSSARTSSARRSGERRSHPSAARSSPASTTSRTRG